MSNMVMTITLELIGTEAQQRQAVGWIHNVANRHLAPRSYVGAINITQSDKPEDQPERPWSEIQHDKLAKLERRLLRRNPDVKLRYEMHVPKHQQQPEEVLVVEGEVEAVVFVSWRTTKPYIVEWPSIDKRGPYRANLTEASHVVETGPEAYAESMRQRRERREQMYAARAEQKRMRGPKWPREVEEEAARAIATII